MQKQLQIKLKDKAIYIEERAEKKMEQKTNIKQIENFHIPRWEELPNIDLYVDQVICFLDEFLSDYVCIEKEGHVLTKTMINNYVKHSVIPPAIKKKYNKEHIAYLFVICILKQLYSINDIAKLIKIAVETAPVEQYFNTFCEELENAISQVFEGKEIKREKEIEQKRYALNRVVYSFANKLYVDKVYLNKFSNSG